MDAGIQRPVEECGDLLAEPQHVIAEVYDDTLAPAVYPVSLPYELWTDTVRSFAHHAGIEFDDLLDAFRVTDEPVAVPDGLDGHYVREWAPDATARPPIVDLAASRKAALAAYDAVKRA